MQEIDYASVEFSDSQTLEFNSTQFVRILYFIISSYQVSALFNTVNTVCDSIFSARSDRSQYFPHRARCQPISLRLISLRFGVTVLREEFSGSRSCRRQSIKAQGEIPVRRCRNRFPRERNASSRRLARLRSSSSLPSRCTNEETLPLVQEE